MMVVSKGFQSKILAQRPRYAYVAVGRQQSSPEGEKAPVHNFGVLAQQQSLPCAFLSQSPTAYTDASLCLGLDGRRSTRRTETPVP